MRFSAVVLTIVAAGLLVATVLLRSPARSSSPEADAPIVAALDVPADVTVQQLMRGVIDPAADELWGRAGEIITTTGVQDLSPKTDADWAVLVEPAERIVQAARLLRDGRRAKDQFEWIRIAEGLESGGQGLLRAIRAKDTTALFDAGGGLYESCNECHKSYWSIEEQEINAAAEAAAEAAARAQAR